MFTKDNRTENFLTRMGVEFRYSNAVAYSDLIEDWESKNLARPTPVRNDAVDSYLARMEAGSPAPAPILHHGKVGYDVLDGIQRLVAARYREPTKFSAYIVVTDSEQMLMAIRMLANANMQGYAEPLEWTKKEAVKVLCLQGGMSTSEVALMGGWRPSDLDKTLSNLKWDNTIVSIGGPQETSDAMIEVLSKKTTQDHLLKHPHEMADFLHMLRQARFSAGDSEPIVNDFFKPISKSDKAHQVYRERLEDIKQTPEVVTRLVGRKSTTIAPDINLRRALRAAHTVLDQIASGNEPLLYVDEFFKLINDLKDKLHKLSKNQKPDRPPTPGDKWTNK